MRTGTKTSETMRQDGESDPGSAGTLVEAFENGRTGRATWIDFAFDTHTFATGGNP